MDCPYCRIMMYPLGDNDPVVLAYAPIKANWLGCPECEYVSIEFDDEEENQ